MTKRSTSRGRCRRWAAFLLIVLAGVSGAQASTSEGSAAVRSLLDSGAHPYARGRGFWRYRDVLQRAYAARAFEPLWVRDGKASPQARSVAALLLHADQDGLVPSDYDAERLVAEVEKLETGSANQRQIAAIDVALSSAAARFAADRYRGRIDPRQAGLDLLVPAKQIDLDQVLSELAQSDDPAERLAALDPPFPAYERLKQGLAQTRQLAAQLDPTRFPPLPQLRPGQAHPQVALLRPLLVAYGDLAVDATLPVDPSQYDDALVSATERFQAHHGLDPDGVLGPATLRQLRVPLSQRVRQVQLALERLRWLPGGRPERTIVVNVPEFRLNAFAAGGHDPALTMNVVVGSAAKKNETPVLRAQLRYVIFRPRWNVPYSILQKEMLPEIRRNPERYFKKEDLEIIGSEGEVLPISLDSIDQLAAGGARVRQRPGPKNSLGLIKFVFPNQNDIYFHDTPSKSLFKRSRRDFSHGCIRVADPVGLAEFALQGVDGWNRTKIESAMHSTDPNKMNVRVTLKSPVPVYVLYTTAVPAEDGTVVFLDDIYGHDARLAPLLVGGT